MSVVGVFGMLVGVLVFMIELIGDYYVCVWLLGVLLFLKYVINRGIGMEGIGCFLVGVWGSGNGIIFYSENIGVIGIIKVCYKKLFSVKWVLFINMLVVE